MSVSELWKDMYFDAQAQLRMSREQAHEERMRVIRLEGQRLTLLAHLELAAKSLLPIYPIVSARLTQVATQLRESYEPAKPQGTVAGDQTSEHRSAYPPREAPVYTDAGTTTREPF